MDPGPLPASPGNLGESTGQSRSAAGEPIPDPGLHGSVGTAGTSVSRMSHTHRKEGNTLGELGVGFQTRPVAQPYVVWGTSQSQSCKFFLPDLIAERQES